MFSNFECEIESVSLSIESGKLALQANGSVLIRYRDCVFLVTATMSKPREGIDFFPLTMEVEERLYSRGKIPGNFFRREGRPSSHGILIARLADRPIRPLFPKGFRNEVQIIITPLSVDEETPIEIFGIIGASAALSLSDIPFDGPVGATRMGYVDGELIVNPTYSQLQSSDLDIIVAGTRQGVTMMEAGVNNQSEDLVLEAIERAQEVNLEIIALQEQIMDSIGKVKAAFDSQSYPAELDDKLTSLLSERLSMVLKSAESKAQQSSNIDELKNEILEQFGEQYETNDLKGAFEHQLKKNFKDNILSGSERPDGRNVKEIRQISSEVALLPRAHGTGLFNRGETQILGVATLGSLGDAQILDTLTPHEKKKFMLHYNFPPYSTGEVRRVGSPGRREIGHGMLAERALMPVMPDEEDFPYTVRLVCEALSSNGSTSMASVCAGTLALMDAGVPIKAPVAGISVGLVVGDDGEYVTLTDIQGLEDHIGDMDFKVAGTETGITAIQLDVKVSSISFEMIRDALTQAKEARHIILQHIGQTISESRPELSPYAPRMIRISIPVSKIGLVIGPSGKTIRGIIEATKASIDIQDDGTVMVGGGGESANKAIKIIEDLTREIEQGNIYTGKVVRLMDFGAFVEILPGRDGLVHISELSDHHVRSVEDEVEVGDEITVIVTEIDNLGRINLSRRALLSDGDTASTKGHDKESRDDVIRQNETRNSRSRPQRGPRPSFGNRPAHRQGPRRDGGRR